MLRGISVVVAVLVAVLGLAACSRSIAGTAVADPSGTAAAASTTGAEPASSRTDSRTSTDGTGVVVGKAGAGIPTVTVYLDFLCPACAEFSSKYERALYAAADAGRLTVIYRPVTFLDGQSVSRTYSSRSAAVLLALANAGSSASVIDRFIYGLFAIQPKEGGTADLSTERLAEVAAASGAADSVIHRIQLGTTGVDGKAVGAANLKLLTAAGGTGTPTVLHDGAQVALTDPSWLQKILG
ncbi:thioredoxin domain-containing protein [Tsukamurella spumae]